MSFNLFASPTQDDIKVGYIDPTLGYVSDASVCEANEYAKNNPGTTFIFRDGDNNIRYLTINEVNKLTPTDLESKDSDKCPGIQNYKECGPPIIQFFGGGGIGAVGNPVIGKDGSLLAVDVVSGGHGYEYPPIVAARDDCQIGNGAVLTAILGETADETEVFEGEEDFEEYEICEDTDVGYGLSYGPNGEEIGPWDPGTYTRVGTDPIKREIELFQKALKKPFWTTRQKQPDRIVVNGDSEYATQEITSVTFPDWGEFMNKYAVSPVRPSDVRGSDEAGKTFKIEWEENFPISGEYIFRGVCDNVGQLYIDDSLVGDLGGFDQNPTPLQKTIQEGNHIVRVDLLNIPFVKKTTTTAVNTSKLKAKFIKKGSSFYLEVTGEGSGKINFVMDVDDNPNIAGLAAKEVVIPADNGKVKFVRKSSNIDITFSEGSRQVQTGQDRFITSISSYKEKETIKDSGTFTAGKTYGPIQIIGAGVGAKGPIINTPNRLGIRDADGNDENIKITIEKTSGGSSASTTKTTEVISPKSWNENPMGVALLIDAPTPPVPQEQPPVQTGPCPPNPIWTTRFPGADQTWYPVRNKRWANFFNRYAISPVLPLDTPGSDGSGIVHKNSWKIDIPYRGFYKFQAQRDNTARIYVDGNLAFDVTTSGDDKWVKAGLVNKVKSQKVFLEKGTHTISIELENTPQDTPNIIETKIFSTQDWRVSQPGSASKLKAKFVKQGLSYYLQVEGSGTGEISFVMDVDDNPFTAGLAAKEVIIPADSGRVKFKRKESTPQKETVKDSGQFTGGKKYGPIQIIGAGVGSRGPIINNPNTLGIRDADGDDENIKITINKISGPSAGESSQSPSSSGVTYSGPKLIGYKHKGWGNFMNDYSVSPQKVNDIGKKTLTWKNVDFPQDGTYKFNFQADNIGLLTIGGKEIFKTSEFAAQPVQYNFNITKGKYDVVIELENISNPKGKNSDNPTGTALYITKDITFSDSNKTSWVQNPIGIGAILIPPPCAKKIGGKGVVDQVIVDDPGNGYLPVQTPGTGYPVTLVLDDVIVEDGGINYRCGEDQIQITPNNGVELSYSCNSFGQISDVQVLNPGVGFNVYPEITIPSETGVNATFRPVFRVVRDPVQLLVEQQIKQEALIQVTDLAGLKQTGYVDGRAYYGAIYYDAGVPYAGYYKTAGTQTRVYATLQESITAQVTTAPSAIQRSGTDIRSNDPRLNIPGTIQDTTEQQ